MARKSKHTGPIRSLVESFVNPSDPRHDEELQKVNERLVLKTLQVQDLAEQASKAFVQAEAERTLLTAVLRQVLDGVIIVEISSGRFLVTNENAERLFPHCNCLADMLAYVTSHCSRYDGTLYAAEDWPLARSIATGERVANEEVAFSCADGTRGTMLVGSGVVPDASGQIIAALLSCEDVTEQKRLADAQRELVAREQAARVEAELAKSASRMKDEFLAVVSHELRTPLTPILGAVYILRTGERKERIFDTALDLIERNALAQARLIEDLLDISRIVSGKLSLNRFRVELRRVVAAAIETFTLAARAKNIEIDFELSAGILVLGDPDRLRQVVCNLLANALKFTPEKGSVAVRLSQAGGQAEIQVQDTGDGIDPKFLPHVFDRFRQADNSTVRSHGGLGIGLAVVHQIVELHGGTVDADSAGKGRGATFTVRLPLAS